jgi:Ca2+-binding RTX toxin-like protein
MAVFPGSDVRDSISSGFDILYGRDGDDSLLAPTGGLAYIEGGRGNDALFFVGLTHGEIYGGSGVDVIAGAELGDELFGGSGNDMVAGGNSGPIQPNGSGQLTPGGPSGNDIIEGGSGADALYGFDGDDQISGGAGDDRGVVTFDNPFAASIAAGLFGGDGDDVMDGGSGDDDIHGEAGADILAGGPGADRFFFDTPVGGGNVDTIMDLIPSEDRIVLSAADFVGIGGPGALKKGAFVKGKKAADKGDRVIYNENNGTLLFDHDGKKGDAAVLFARLDKDLKLAATDFTIVA